MVRVSLTVWFSDFKSVMAAGYRPGYSRISELENVVSVSCKVNSLNVDLRTLQAWDSDLITGEVVYLILLLFFGSKYPVDADNGSRSVRFAIGISPKPKPSKKAIHSASRSTVPSGIWTSAFSLLFLLSTPSRVDTETPFSTRE